MNADISLNANVLIQELKNTIDQVWAKYGNKSLNKLRYAQGGHNGAMQYEELKENLLLLHNLKKNLDWLAEESLTLSDYRQTDAQQPEGPARRQAG